MSLLKGTERLADFDAAWETRSHGKKLRAIRLAAEKVHDRFAGGPRVVSVRTLALVTLPYPTRFAFNGLAFSPAPYVTLTHRCLFVQFLQNGALKNLLFNPTDIDAARATPYFSRIAEKFSALEPVLSKKYDPLEVQLERVGIAREDIDYVAFDHFHTQDLRRLLGTNDSGKNGERARFPNATLLAPKREWDDWDDLHPLQEWFFVRDGKKNVVTKRVALTEHDLALGDGVMLLRTPGHTSGNQTLFLATDTGVWGISENGTCADNWSPLESRIAGLAAACRARDADVAINSNTPEEAANQYTSMILERTMADRVKRAPAFVQMFSSSEVTPGFLAPGLSPTILHKAITTGEVAKVSAKKEVSLRAAASP
jgi:glyoxylase-like metal-dependent hydrolase (beta-lactamase superfamily II)